MIAQSPLLFGLPTTVLDMTSDFTPLFVGLVVGLGFCVLAFAIALGAYDNWWSQRRAQETVKYPQSLPNLPELPDTAR